MPCSKGRHHDHADIPLVRKRENASLSLVVNRVVGDLDRADLFGFHNVDQSGKGRVGVVCYAGGSNRAFGLQGTKDGEIFVPRDKVVYLINVDQSAKVAQRFFDLLSPLRNGRRPYLGRDERAFAVSLQGSSKYCFSSPVHG